MKDLTYFTKGPFIGFIANTDEGEKIYTEMHEQNGSATIHAKHLKTVLHQIKKAGYTVSKAKKSKLTLDEILNDPMFDELGI